MNHQTKLPDQTNLSGRRLFLKTAAAVSAGLTGMLLIPNATYPNSTGANHPDTDPDPSPTVIGPRQGYSPQIGTFVSMMGFCRYAVERAVKGMTTEQLDYLLDDKANSIGALLYHLAATDAYYHEHTFKGLEWGKFDESVTKKFDVAMSLGEPARKTIKGNNVDFYLGLLKETREKTLAEFRKRDDAWFMTIDKTWPWGPTNNYCKWFHVCEHESHHQGQMALIKSRIPGIKAAE
ncbi:DinB family protein [Flavitalea flava]